MNTSYPARDLYLKRMENCNPFKMFGVEPIWEPDTKDIDGFIHDEVVRQFHDPRVQEDGGKRIVQMTRAWKYAQNNNHFVDMDLGVVTEELPTIDDMLAIAKMIEPEENAYGFRKYGVQVGDRICPDWNVVLRLITNLWTTIKMVEREDGLTMFYREAAIIGEPGLFGGYPTVDDFYLEFEKIHPLGDGNGRTGKVLYNWLMGTLDNPILVEDYFNAGNP